MTVSNVLLVGEKGTGKSMVARAIHQNSERNARGFVAVSCGSLSEAEFESEIFTGEVRGGTLLLDDVDELSPALQLRLFTAFQEGRFEQVDIRVIATAKRDLDALVKMGKFREELYYRFKVIVIELPPLRERLEDLPELVSYFVARYAARNHKTISHVSDEAMEQLRRYPWPGNVREFEGAIESAVALASSSVLYPEDFPREVTRGGVAVGGSVPDAGVVSLEDMERAHILKVLQGVHFNKSKASEILGIDRATLYRKAQRYHIDLKGK